jgi:hypothetical protein
MSEFFDRGESRLGQRRKRPSCNHVAPTTRDKPPASLDISFDDRFQSPVGVAPFIGNSIGTVDDRCDLAPTDAGALAVDGDDGVTEMDAVAACRTVWRTGETPLTQDVRDCAQHVDMFVQGGNADSRKVQPYGSHGDQRTSNNNGNMKARRFQNKVLQAIGIEVDMRDARKSSHIKVTALMTIEPIGSSVDG